MCCTQMPGPAAAHLCQLPVAVAPEPAAARAVSPRRVGGGRRPVAHLELRRVAVEAPSPGAPHPPAAAAGAVAEEPPEGRGPEVDGGAVGPEKGAPRVLQVTTAAAGDLNRGKMRKTCVCVGG